MNDVCSCPRGRCDLKDSFLKRLIYWREQMLRLGLFRFTGFALGGFFLGLDGEQFNFKDQS